MRSERKWATRPEDLLATEEVHRGVEDLVTEEEAAHLEEGETSPEAEVVLQEEGEISQEVEEVHQGVARLEVILEVDQGEAHLEVTQEAALEVAQEVDHLGVDPEAEMKEGHSEEEALPSEAVNDLFILSIN